MGDIVALALLGVLGLLLVSAGIEDVHRREIVNWKTAAIALLAPFWWWALGLSLWPDIAWQVGVAALVFGAFVAAFAVGQMGGGDVKLIGALALWLPLQPFVTSFIWMALIGGGLTVIMVADDWIRRRAPPPRPPLTAWALLAAVVVGGMVARSATTPELVFEHPAIVLTVASLLLGGVTVLLLMATRSVRRRGIAPETPYGVAIALAALLTLREPIINQFG